MAVNLNSAPKI